MLDAMRKASQGWVGRIVMTLVMVVLIASFAIWGIGDMFSGFGGDNLAKVGGVEITTQQFRSAYLRQLTQLQQQTKQPITTQQAHAMGLDSQVLSKLVADTVLDSEARRLGLAMSDKAVAQTIVQDPAFKGPTGQFDSNVFASVLQNNGLTEAMLVNEQRGLYLRREVGDAVAGGMPVPNVMLDAVERYRDETRSIDYAVLSASAAGVIPAPTGQQLKAFFDARREAYLAPEYRKLVVLALTPASVADPATVSDADARAVYEKNQASYGAPEKRQLRQATFATQQEAMGAVAKIKGGADFDAAAKDAKATVVDLGLMTRVDLFDPTIAQAAFSAPQGGVSAPIKGQFGWVLIKVVKVQPASVKPFSEVEPAIKKELADQRAGAKVDSLRDRIEDQRTSGKTLTQAAQSVGLKTTVVDAADAQGLDKSGHRIADLPDRDALLKAAFASDVGLDNDILTTPDGGDVWFEVAAVDPAHQRSFAEVEPELKTAWREDQISQRLAEKARELVKKLQAGAAFDALAKAESVPVETANDVKRIGTTDVPAAVVAQVFNVPVGGAGSAASDPQSRVLFKVNDSVTPPVDLDSDATKGIISELRDGLSEDVLSEYLAKLQSDAGVSVNPAAMASAISGAQQY